MPENLDTLGEELCRMMDRAEEERDQGGWAERVKSNQWMYENRPPLWSIPFLKGSTIHNYPAAQPKLDHLCAKVITTIFSQNPVLLARLHGGSTDQASRIERQIEFFIEDHLEDALDSLAPIAAYAGVGILAVDFEAIAHGYTPLTPPKRVLSGSPVAYAGPVFQNVHPLNFGIWPASVSDIQSSQMVFHRFYRQERDIRSLQKIGRYLKDERKLQGMDHPANYDAEGDYDQWAKGAEVYSDKDGENLVELRQVIFRGYENDIGWYVATVACRDKRILRLEKYKRSRPGYVDFRFLAREPGSFWPARSLGSDLSALQYLYNYVTNILCYGSAISAFSPIATDGDLKKAQNWGPKSFVTIPGATKFEFIKSPFDPGAFPLVQREIMRQMDAVTRVTQEETGVAISKQQTKGEFIGRQSGAQTGISKFIQTFGRGISEIGGIMQELLEMHYSLWVTAYPEQKFVESVLDLKAPVKFEIQGKSPEDAPAYRIGKYQQAYQLAMASTQRRMALKQPPLFNLDALEKSIMNDFRLPNIQEIVIEQPASLGQLLSGQGMGVNPQLPPEAVAVPQGEPAQGPLQ